MRSFVRQLLNTAIVLGLASSTAVGYSTSLAGETEVPSAIEVPAGYVAFFQAHAIGTQNYVCVPADKKFVWKLFGPQATLFGGVETPAPQVATHFLSVNPEEGVARPTWQHSFDTSSVWGRALASSSDPAYVADGAIPWLLVQVVGAQSGPGGGSALTSTVFIQRVNTVGGTAPATGCSTKDDAGTTALVPYAADYVFYMAETER
jgi:hypothetical protein